MITRPGAQKKANIDPSNEEARMYTIAPVGGEPTRYTLLDPRAQALVKAAEAREIVCMKADLIRDDHWRGTGGAIIGAMELLLKSSR